MQEPRSDHGSGRAQGQRGCECHRDPAKYNRPAIGLLHSSDHFKRLHARSCDIAFEPAPQGCDALVELRRDQLTSTRLHFPNCGLKIVEPQGNTFVQFSRCLLKACLADRRQGEDGVALLDADALNCPTRPISRWASDIQGPPACSPGTRCPIAQTFRTGPS